MKDLETRRAERKTRAEENAKEYAENGGAPTSPQSQVEDAEVTGSGRSGIDKSEATPTGWGAPQRAGNGSGTEAPAGAADGGDKPAKGGAKPAKGSDPTS